MSSIDKLEYLKKLEENFDKKNIELKIFCDVVDSTNNWAKQLSYIEQNFLCVAPFQTMGRGRLDRSFASNEGGIYMTLKYTPDNLKASEALKVVLITGLCIAQELELLTGDVKIKWPNDIYIKGKKICGILLESVIMGDLCEKLFIGMGINVNNQLPNELINIATALRDFGVSISCEELISNIIVRLLGALKIFEKEGFQYFERDYCEKSYTIGKDATVTYNNEKISGRAIGLTKEGYLLLDKGGQILTVTVGDVNIN